MTVSVSIKRLDHGKRMPLPSYETLHSAGMDLRAAIDAPIEIAPRGRAMIPTGLAIGLPDGYEAQIRPRSGLAAKHGLTVLNSPGTIDADYRGEVKILLINTSDDSFTVTPEMRIAQMIVAPFIQVSWDEQDELTETVRGAGGFGSTGT